MINFKQFQDVQMKVGLIKEAEDIEESNNLLSLKVDIGEEELRQIIAGLKNTSYNPDNLKGKKVIVVANLEPKKLLGYESQGMVLAASNDDQLTLLTVDQDIPVGAKIS